MFSHHVKIERIVEKVKTLYDIGMLNEAEKHDLGWKLADSLIFHPCMVGDFTFDDELDGNFVTLLAIGCGHDETIATRAQLVLELVLFNKVAIERVISGKARAVQIGVQVQV